MQEAVGGFSLDEDYVGFGIRYRKTEEGRPNLLTIENLDGSISEYSNFPNFYTESVLSDDCAVINTEIIKEVEDRIKTCEKCLHDAGSEVGEFAKLFRDYEEKLGKFEKSFLAQHKLLSLKKSGLIDYFDSLSSIKQAFFLESEFNLSEFNLDNLRKINWLIDLEEGQFGDVLGFNPIQIKLKKIGVIFDQVMLTQEEDHSRKCNWELMIGGLERYRDKGFIINEILSDKLFPWQLQLMELGISIDRVYKIEDCDKNNEEKWLAILEGMQFLVQDPAKPDLDAVFDIVKTFSRSIQWNNFGEGMPPVKAGLSGVESPLVLPPRPSPSIVRPALAPRPAGAPRPPTAGLASVLSSSNMRK